jgi:8-oxo-dGTP diphosphatase
MKPRAAVILIKGTEIALIERNRSGMHYYVFPGGKIKSHETASSAAARETWEELGLQVHIGQMIAEVWYMGVPQYYFLVKPFAGQFGHGTGSEMNSLLDSEKGTYLPMWMPVEEIIKQPVLPKLMAQYVLKYQPSSWPREPLLVTDRPIDEPGEL